MPNNLTFYDICHKITFAIWRPLTFQDPWHFVTFNTSWHLTLHDIFHFMTFFISLNNPLFKYIPHFGSFWHFVIYFQEYATCWVFLALHQLPPVWPNEWPEQILLHVNLSASCPYCWSIHHWCIWCSSSALVNLHALFRFHSIIYICNMYPLSLFLSIFVLFCFSLCFRLCCVFVVVFSFQLSLSLANF